jgi:hypothetical protein
MEEVTDLCMHEKNLERRKDDDERVQFLKQCTRGRKRWENQCTRDFIIIICLVYVNCTKVFYCDISTHACNVL